MIAGSFGGSPIIDLLKRIVTVSMETMKIVDALPALDILDGKAVSDG